MTSEPVACGGGVVTGMSCGVDSLYTLHCYDRPDALGGSRLTHLAYYDCNYLLPFAAPPYDIRAIYREKEQVFSHIIDHAGIIAGHDSDMVETSLRVPTQHYEGLLCDCCQTETLHYVTSDDASRPEKLKALADEYDNEAGHLFRAMYDALDH